MAIKHDEITFTVSNCDFEKVADLAATMQALGLDVEFEQPSGGKRTAPFTVRNLPDKWDAERMRTRHAGRVSQGIRPPAGSVFDMDTTCVEFLAWQEEHTAQEGMDALGLKPATYYRRLRKIREHVEEQEQINARRRSDPTWTGGFVDLKLSDIL